MVSKKVFRFWLIIFFGILVFFILLQVPAAWLLSKFSPNLRNIHNVSGNIWQGEADWSYQQLQGTVSWTTYPWELLRLRASTRIKLHTGQTELTGVVSYGIGDNLYIRNLDGKISPDTLANLVKWQWPSSNLMVQDIALNFKKGEGFKSAEGQMAWAGGSLSYPMEQRAERIDVPPLVAQLDTDQNKLKMMLKDSQQQRMADMVLGADGMLDVQITQRFLLNAPSYKGQAGMDTAVISTRQPIASLRGM